MIPKRHAISTQNEIDSPRLPVIPRGTACRWPAVPVRDRFFYARITRWRTTRPDPTPGTQSNLVRHPDGWEPLAPLQHTGKEAQSDQTAWRPVGHDGKREWFAEVLRTGILNCDILNPASVDAIHSWQPLTHFLTDSPKEIRSRGVAGSP